MLKGLGFACHEDDLIQEKKYRIDKNLKLRKKEVFLRGTSCLYTYLPTCVCTRVCTTFALDESHLSYSESLRVATRGSVCFDFT